MSPDEIDQIRLNFNPGTLMLLNIVLGLIMFGVALDLRIGDFVRVFRSPKAPVLGLLCQFLLLPALTFLLVIWIQPAPSLALGMMLVAACPGGNISNFMTHLARGNTAVSVSMSAGSTAAAIFFTPANVAFWGSRYEPTAAILRQVALDPLDMLFLVFVLLGVPLVLGLLISHRFPGLADRLRRPFKFGSIAVFLLIVVLAFAGNWQNFLDYIHLVVLIVLLHNATALALGYLSSRALRLPEEDARAVAIEVGIQNSGLGLLLIFGFFQGLGGMALVAAWWGIWHIIAGLSVATFWSRRSIDLPESAGA